MRHGSGSPLECCKLSLKRAWSGPLRLCCCVHLLLVIYIYFHWSRSAGVRNNIKALFSAVLSLTPHFFLSGYEVRYPRIWGIRHFLLCPQCSPLLGCPWLHFPDSVMSPVSSLTLVKTNVPAVCSRGYLLTSTLSSSHLLTGLLVIFARTHRLCAAAVFGYICNCNLCAGKLSFLVLCLWCMMILKVDKIKCNGNVHKRREVLMFIVRGNFMN